jgi:hypothetical protein
MCRAGCGEKICQAAQTNGRVKSLELQTIPDLTYSWGYKQFSIMVIYQHTDTNGYSIFDTDPDLKYISGRSSTMTKTMEAKPTKKPHQRKEEGVYSIGDVFFVNHGKNGSWCEITALEPIKSNIADKIKNCNTMAELDTLRIEIVSDKENFVENQKLFLSAKNRIKRNAF